MPKEPPPESDSQDEAGKAQNQKLDAHLARAEAAVTDAVKTIRAIRDELRFPLSSGMRVGEENES